MFAHLFHFLTFFLLVLLLLVIYAWYKARKDKETIGTLFTQLASKAEAKGLVIEDAFLTEVHKLEVDLHLAPGTTIAVADTAATPAASPAITKTV